MAKMKIGEYFRSLVFKYYEISQRDDFELDNTQARAWAMESEMALRNLFPPDSPILNAWYMLTEGDGPFFSIGQILGRGGAVGIIQAAANMIEAGQVETFADAVRAETEGELLDQAEDLAKNGYVAAAVVIAGGALETHLKQYCKKHGVTPAGHGSISSFNNAVSQARKGSPNLYSAADSKQVEAWGALRNSAAHEPGKFDRPAANVELLVMGIRQFISRTT